MRTTRSPKALLPLIMAITGMGVLGMSAVVPILPDLAEALGVSRGVIGLAQGVIAVPGIFLAVYIGYLADRFGRRAVIIASLAIFGIAGTASFFATSFTMLIVLRLIQGLGTSGLLSLGVVLVGDLFTGLERRWAMGLNLAGLTATTTLAPIVSGFLAEGGTFRPFLLYAIAFPLMAAAMLLPGRPDGPPPGKPLAHLRAALSALRDRGRLTDFLGMLPMSLITLGTFIALGLTVTPLFLERVFDVGVSGRGLIQAVLSAASSVASVLSGRVGRRYAPARVLSVSLGLMGVGFAVVAVAPNLWLVALGLAVLGTGSGSIFPLLQDYSASAGPAAYRGALVGTWVSANRVGQAGGPIAGSLLADGIGERSTYGIGAAVMVAVAVVWLPTRSWARRQVT